MTRGRLVLSFLLFLALCASIAYWGLQLYDPPLRPVAPSAQVELPAPRVEAAASVFGGQASSAVAATNFQLRGVIVAGTARDSVAIIEIEGKPPRAFRVNAEVAPGVTVQEVHRHYVLLSEGGALKRVELPAAARGGLQSNDLAARRTAPVQSAPVQSAPVQTAPAASTTVVIQEQQPAQQATEGTDASAPSADANEPGQEGNAEAESDPAQMQARPPRR